MKSPMFQPCVKWAEKLVATHQDDLSPAEWKALEAHIAQCPACAAIRAEYQLMDGLIRNYPSREALVHSPSLPLLPRQLASDNVRQPLPMLDIVYKRSLREPLSRCVPFLSTSPYSVQASIMLLIVIACLIAILLLGVYFLNTGGLGF